MKKAETNNHQLLKDKCSIIVKQVEVIVQEDQLLRRIEGKVKVSESLVDQCQKALNNQTRRDRKEIVKHLLGHCHTM